MIEKTYFTPTTEYVEIQSGLSILNTSLGGSSVENADYRDGIDWN